MPQILSIPDIIEISDVSVGLSLNYTSKKTLWGGSIIPPPIPPIQIAIIADALRWGYEGGAQSAQELRNEGNYLWWMLGMFQLQAQQIIGNGSGGGSVIPTPSGGVLPNDIDWMVGLTASGIAPLADQEGFVTLNGTNGMPDLRGFKINFFREGATQQTTPKGDGSTYYYWNRVTGLFQLLGGPPANGAAQLTELMRISPDLVGSGTVTNLYEPVRLSLDADGTYTLPDGYFIFKINIKPTSADTVKIGTTLAGDEIMFDKVMTPNVYGDNGVTYDVFADGANQIIYFTGFTTTAAIDIYILPI